MGLREREEKESEKKFYFCVPRLFIKMKRLVPCFQFHFLDVLFDTFYKKFSTFYGLFDSKV